MDETSSKHASSKHKRKERRSAERNMARGGADRLAEAARKREAAEAAVRKAAGCARNLGRRDHRPKLRLYSVEHIDAGRLYERAQQPWRRGLAHRYNEAEARVINEIAKRRWPDSIIGPPRPGDHRTPLARWIDWHLEFEAHFHG